MLANSISIICQCFKYSFVSESKTYGTYCKDSSELCYNMSDHISHDYLIDSIISEEHDKSCSKTKQTPYFFHKNLFRNKRHLVGCLTNKTFIELYSNFIFIIGVLKLT